MGSAMSCERCTTAPASSVINLSDALISRIVDGVEEEHEKTLSVSSEDQEWIERLKCMDDAHTTAYGLIPEDILSFTERIERRIKEFEMIEHCPTNFIKACLKYNPECSLNCAKEIEDFINCLDAKRLHRLKLLWEDDKKKMNKIQT